VVHPWCDLRLVWLLDLHLAIKAWGLSRTDVLDAGAAWQVAPAVSDALTLAAALGHLETSHTNCDGQRATPGWQRRLLDRMEQDLDGPASLPDKPWWLQAGARTGFRPIRLMPT
jgi:hypothetical protein